MKHKPTFIITVSTTFGIGIIKKKGDTAMEAFLKLSKKDMLKATMIEDEDGNSKSINELLGIELDS